MAREHEYGKLVNLTGHDVTLIAWDDQAHTVPSDGQMRIYSNADAVGMVRSGVHVPLLEIVEQRLSMAADEEPGTLYIVSGIVAAKARRDDFVTPSRVVRDKSGRAIGCRALARIRL
jgi:hypothetical protein